MTRLAAGGRAQQPGLACAWWWRSRARARKARIQQAAHRVWLERSETSPDASDRVTQTLTHGDAQKPPQRDPGHAETGNMTRLAAFTPPPDCTCTWLIRWGQPPQRDPDPDCPVTMHPDWDGLP